MARMLEPRDWTYGDAGLLELEAQDQRWAEIASINRQRRESICEVTRLMLIPKVRGGPALAWLILGALLTIDWTQQRRLYGAGRLGGLTRLYQSLGFLPLPAGTGSPYYIGGLHLGQYQLLCVNSSKIPRIKQILHRKIGST